jgi:hypothetical protein
VALSGIEAWERAPAATTLSNVVTLAAERKHRSPRQKENKGE